MSRVVELPLRPAPSRRLLGPLVALFVAAAVVVVLLLAAAESAPERSSQAGSSVQYQHPRAAPLQYLHSRGEDARSRSR
jgi:hypothetical protein